jgi:hypothetical protein
MDEGEFLVPPSKHDEHQSISLEDYYMVKKTLHMHGFLIFVRFSLFSTFLTSLGQVCRLPFNP